MLHVNQWRNGCVLNTVTPFYHMFAVVTLNIRMYVCAGDCVCVSVYVFLKLCASLRVCVRILIPLTHYDSLSVATDCNR